MKDFHRKHRLLSLCGLNCGLCEMHIGGYCPGCGGGEGNQSCTVARCSLKHEGVEFCSQCEEFPCSYYDKKEPYDSFITHRNYRKDLERAAAIGIDAYEQEQESKIRVLLELLKNYNAGRQKRFYCLAVNLLSYEDVMTVMKQIGDARLKETAPVKEKAAFAVKKFQEKADARGILLKLRKKSGGGN